MTADRSTYQQGLLDTNIMILRRWVAPEELPDEMAITAITPGALHEADLSDSRAPSVTSCHVLFRGREAVQARRR